VTWLALFVLVFIVPLGAPLNDHALLLGLNKFVWISAFYAIIVFGAIAIFACRIAFIAFLDS